MLGLAVAAKSSALVFWAEEEMQFNLQDVKGGRGIKQPWYWTILLKIIWKGQSIGIWDNRKKNDLGLESLLPF